MKTLSSKWPISSWRYIFHHSVQLPHHQQPSPIRSPCTHLWCYPWPVAANTLNNSSSGVQASYIEQCIKNTKNSFEFREYSAWRFASRVVEDIYRKAVGIFHEELWLELSGGGYLSAISQYFVLVHRKQSSLEIAYIRTCENILESYPLTN